VSRDPSMIMIPTDRPVRSVERKRLTICLRIPPLSTHKGRRGRLGRPDAPHGEDGDRKRQRCAILVINCSALRYNASLKCQAYTMRNLRKKLLDQAIAAMIAAIEVYNKPDFKYRDESFAILAINAWELLIKARWLMIMETVLMLFTCTRMLMDEGVSKETALELL
jgi:hypothetical protein